MTFSFFTILRFAIVTITDDILNVCMYLFVHSFIHSFMYLFVLSERACEEGGAEGEGERILGMLHAQCRAQCGT